MTHMTAAVLHETMLLMKHTPSDIGRVTNELFSADDRTLKAIPRQAYQHYFDEVGIAFLNWIGRGQSDNITETLRSLSHTVFSAPEMEQLPELNTKQRVGLHLRSVCAQMTLFLKVQSSASYTAMLTGDRNVVSRVIVQVLYDSAIQSADGFGFGALDYKTIWRSALQRLSRDKKTSAQNVHHHLRELVSKGLAVEERSGKSVRYRLSERGVYEARYHFGQAENSEPIKNPVLDEKISSQKRVSTKQVRHQPA